MSERDEAKARADRVADLREHVLKGKGGMVPPELLLSDLGDPCVRLYALIRALSSSCDTKRTKESLADALGWSPSKVYRVARLLSASGWLTVKRFRQGPKDRSTWSVPRALTGDSPGGFRTVTSESPRTVTSDSGADCHQRQWDTPPTPHHLTPPPYPPEGGGALTAVEDLTADRIWSLIPSSDRALAPAGTDRLREALAELLARPPRRTTREQLVGAFRDRLAKRLGLGGVSDVRGLLRSAAREVDHDEAATWIAERLRVVRVDQATPDEPPADQLERVDVAAHIGRLAASTHAGVVSRPSRPRKKKGGAEVASRKANAHGAPERPEKETA